MLTIAQLTRLPRKFSKYYDRQFLPLLEKTDLTMREVHVLLFLANHPGQDTARDVTELRGLAKSQVSQAVEIMAGRGLLAWKMYKAPLPEEEESLLPEETGEDPEEHPEDD